MSIRYSTNYLNRILKYQMYLNNIWTFVSKKFTNRLKDLFSFDGDRVRKALENCKVSFFFCPSQLIFSTFVCLGLDYEL